MAYLRHLWDVASSQEQDLLVEASIAALKARRRKDLEKLRGLGLEDADIEQELRRIISNTLGPKKSLQPNRDEDGEALAMSLTLTPHQRAALQAVKEGGGVVKARLVYDTLVTTGVIEPVQRYHVARVMWLLNRLVEMGLLVKSGDRHHVTLSLTNLGERTLAAR